MGLLRAEVKKKTLFWYGLVGLAFLFYLYSVLSRIGQPLAEDELNWLVAAKNLSLTGRPYLYAYTFPGALGGAMSPHLYLYAIKFAFDLFGIHDAVARWPGILSGFLTLILVFLITRHFIGNEKKEAIPWAAITTLLYATTPAFVQGSVILENDNTLLVPAVLFLVFSFIKYQEKETTPWALASGLAVAFSLGVRVTTPAVVMFLLGVYALAGKSSLRSKFMVTAVMISGTLAFLVGWFAYCRLKEIPFSAPFAYTLRAFWYRASQAGGLRLDKIFLNFVYFTLWVGVFPTLLFLLLAIRRGVHFLTHRKAGFEGLFLITGLGIVGGYTLVGGLPFGFPKYHSPGIVLMVVFSGLALHQTNPSGLSSIRLRNAGMAIALAFLIQIFTLNDSLYLLRYQFREALVFASPGVYGAFLREVALKAGLYLFLFTILFISCLKFSLIQNPCLLLILSALGSNVATCTLQNSRGYQTGYEYGVRGTVEAARFIRDRVAPRDFVVARSQIKYYLDRLRSTHLVDAVWNDEEELTRIIREPGTGAFSYSVATNPVDQIKRLSNYEPLQRLLRQEFDPHTIGSFKIWIRKKT